MLKSNIIFPDTLDGEIRNNAHFFFLSECFKNVIKKKLFFDYKNIFQIFIIKYSRKKQHKHVFLDLLNYWKVYKFTFR